jgi:rare lipoprotein A
MGGRGPAGLRRLLPLGAVAVVLAACSGPGPHGGGQSHSVGHYRVGAPYQINGVWYSPAVNYNYDETGIASWYGEQFNGRSTANGEIFDLNQLTAAHRTLQLPCIVEVTNLDNGRSLRLRVNDRGPFAYNRIIDVSRRAAQLLGFEGNGTAHVRVRILRDESIRVAEAAMRNDNRNLYAAAAPIAAPMSARPAAEPPPAMVAAAQPPAASHGVPILAQPPPAAQETAFDRARSLVISPAAAEPLPPPPEQIKLLPRRPAGRIYVQAGSFAVAENARRVRARIAPLGSVEMLASSVRGAPMYRVRVGPVATLQEADSLLIAVIGSGYPGARIVVD